MGGVIRRSPPPPQPAPTPMPSPTQAEVSQSETTNMDGGSSYGISVRRKGRSATIITGPKGIQNENVTLGKPSLLGQ
jgi:hypothetical protein